MKIRVKHVYRSLCFLPDITKSYLNFVDSRMEQGLVLRDAMLEIQARVGYSPQISNVWLGHPHASKVHLQYKDSLEMEERGNYPMA